MLSYRKYSYFIPYYFDLLSIVSFCGLTLYAALSYDLFTAFSHFILSFFQSVSWWDSAEARSGVTFIPDAIPALLVVPVLLTPYIFHIFKTWPFSLFEAGFYSFHWPVKHHLPKEFWLKTEKFFLLLRLYPA